MCGPTGAGKTTYSVALAKEINAVRFSIDPWMQTLFAKDMTALDYEWMIERVYRCYEQIWDVTSQILGTGGHVILDLGFTEKAQRTRFTERASELNHASEVHYVKAPADVRKQRVALRNTQKDPTVYAFDVTDDMFHFMEPRFEVPDDQELINGTTIDNQ